MNETLKLHQINMRDPYILADKKTKKYYLFGTTSAGTKGRFDMYVSNDLESWNGPKVIYNKDDCPSFWGIYDFWAPEAYYLEDKDIYIIFATLRGDTHKRGTVAFYTHDLLNEPFQLYSDQITPSRETNLDGTLYYDDNHVPHIIYCHEWIEIHNGSFVMTELSPDLKSMISGTDQLLFRASEIPWSVVPHFTSSKYDYISDGPFVYSYGRVKFLLYSTYGKDLYQSGYCYSTDGFKTVKHAKKPLTPPNSGHSMIFQGFDQETYLIYHANNSENVVIPTIKRLGVKKKLFGQNYALFIKSDN